MDTISLYIHQKPHAAALIEDRQAVKTAFQKSRDPLEQCGVQGFERLESMNETDRDCDQADI